MVRWASGATIVRSLLEDIQDHSMISHHKTAGLYIQQGTSPGNTTNNKTATRKFHQPPKRNSCIVEISHSLRFTETKVESGDVSKQKWNLCWL